MPGLCNSASISSERVPVAERDHLHQRVNTYRGQNTLQRAGLQVQLVTGKTVRASQGWRPLRGTPSRRWGGGRGTESLRGNVFVSDPTFKSPDSFVQDYMQM